jgi:HK97 gp10 family phage protein
MNVKIDYEVNDCITEFAQDMYDELVESFYKTAERIRDTAQGLVAVLTGRLRDTIRARRSRKKNTLAKLTQFLTSEGGYYQDDPAAFVFAGDRQGSMGDPVYWQYWVEYGTYDKPAQPFMRPAVDANFNPMLAESERAGRRAINKRRRLRRRSKGST